MFSERWGLPSPRSSEIRHSVCMILLVVYLGPGTFSSEGINSSFIFLPNQFLGHVVYLGPGTFSSEGINSSFDFFPNQFLGQGMSSAPKLRKTHKKKKWCTYAIVARGDRTALLRVENRALFIPGIYGCNFPVLRAPIRSDFDRLILEYPPPCAQTALSFEGPRRYCRLILTTIAPPQTSDFLYRTFHGC